MCQQLLLYDNSSAHHHLTCQTLISACPSSPKPPSHPKLVYLPFFGMGNTIIVCARLSDAQVIMRWPYIPIPMHPLLYPPLQAGHHQMDLTIPIFNIRELSGEVHFPLRCLHHCEHGTDTPLPAFPIPMTL